MTIINIPNDGIYPELIALVRAVAYSKKILKDDLITACFPPLDKLDFEAKRKEILTRLRGALSRWTALGLFVENDGFVELHENFSRKKKETIDTLTERLPSFCRQLVLQEKHCMPVWSDDGISTDFARGISWLLAQNIYQFSAVFSAVDPLQLEQATEGKNLSLNDVRWNGLRFWARYLGFVTGEGNSFKIDPTVAIREELPAIFGAKKELPANDFIEKLSVSLPVLDFGTCRKDVEANLNPVYWRRPDDQHLSMSLSFALRRLHLNNEIVLTGRADAGTSFRLTGRGYRTWEGFESVMLVGGTK